MNYMKLRSLEFDDNSKIVGWRNSKHVLKNFLDKRKITVESHNQWYKNEVVTGNVKQFIIVLDNGEEIGSVYLRNIDKLNSKAELGIFIGEKTAIGKGYGTQAVALLCDYGFNELGLHKIFLRVVESNQTAISAYRKNGFEIEGVAKDDVWDTVNKKFINVVFMSKLKKN